MYWNWKIGGVVLGLTFLLAVAIVKPIGVSTQFVILDGMIAKNFDSTLVTETPGDKPSYSSTNPYLNKSKGKYAKSVAKPLNYGFIFALSMILGGLIGRVLTKPKKGKAVEQVPLCHQQRFGKSAVLRYLLAFIGGIIVLLGARLAGGCTSGHMMSGMMQTALSGYLFAAAAFAAAIPVAIIIYKK